MNDDVRYRAALPAAVDVPTRALPELVSLANRERLGRAAERLFAAFEALGAIARDSTELDPYLCLTPDLARLCRSPSVVPRVQLFTRYDVLGGLDGEFQFIESNAGDPSGLGYVDGMVAAHRACGSPYAFDDLAGSHIARLSPYFDGGCLVLATDRDSPIRTDLVCLAQRYIQAGIDARVADTRELCCADDVLLHEGTRVSVLHRDLVEEYLDAPFWPAVAPITELLMRGRVPVVNPFAASLLDSKALIEVMTSAEAANYFDSDTVSFLQGALPWTRRVTEAMREIAVAEKDGFVLKPSRGYGGAGVTVGRGVSAAEWEERVVAAIAHGGFVVQRYVAPYRSHDFDVVYGVWVHGGDFAGAFARVGRGDVLNVHRGGALVPVAYGSYGTDTLDRCELQ